MAGTSRLLIDEPPIAITPALVRALGGHDLAAFAQQVHWVSLSIDGREADGHRWAVQSLEEWCDDVVLTAKQARRVIATLTEMGVLIRWTPPGTYDRTAWSRIDLEALELKRADRVSPKRRGRSAAPRSERSRPDGPAVPLTEKERDRDKSSAPAAADAVEAQEPPTVNQRVRAIAVGFYDWITEQAGRRPSALTVPQLIGVLKPFIENGVEDRKLKQALVDMYNGGEFLTRQAIERKLDGRAPRRRAGKPSMMEGLRALQFDDDGNLVTPA